MSVFDNVALGMCSRTQYSLLDAFLKLPKARRGDAIVKKKTLELLELVNLGGYAKEKAGSLPYGLQRRLELARAMAASPDLLLLDEPAAGMNEDECRDLVRLVRLIHDTKGYAIILIEHHMNVVMELCTGSQIYVLNLGKILAVGSPSEIQNNPSVIQAYLGNKRVKNGSQSTAITN